ncbi:hypothetical protein BS642_05970 [Chromobacterium violaceum]|nr:hypothetical protein BS642_05970 [Chromobacterium violaceum]
MLLNNARRPPDFSILQDEKADAGRHPTFHVERGLAGRAVADIARADDALSMPSIPMRLP